MNFTSFGIMRTLQTLAGAAALMAPALAGAAANHIGPVLRWSFSQPAGTIANGTVLLDSVQGLPAVVRGTGATNSGNGVVLPGGSSMTAAYIDLPNGMVSRFSSNNFNTGEVSYEVWLRVFGGTAQNWARIFDFGNTTLGEVSGPGPNLTFTANDQFLLTAVFANTVGSRRMQIFDTSDGRPYEVADYASAGYGVMNHVVVTWREATGEIRIYEDGELKKTTTTVRKFHTFNDVNCWLGRSSFASDSNVRAEFDEFRVYDRVLADDEVARHAALGADTAPIFPLTSIANYWHASGNALDAMGRTDGVPTNGLSFGPGRSGSGFVFDGVDDMLVLTGTTTPLQPPWTMGVWVKRENAAGPSAALLFAPDRTVGNTALKLEQSGTARRVGLTVLGVIDESFPYAAPTNEWVHLTFVGETNATRLYVNGSLLAGTINRGIALPRARLGDPIDVPKGAIDQMVIFPRLLTTAEIAGLPAATAGGYSRPVSGQIVTTGGAVPGQGVGGATVTLQVIDGALTSVRQIPYGVVRPAFRTNLATMTIDDAPIQVPVWPGGFGDRFAAVYDGYQTQLLDSIHHLRLQSDDGSVAYLNSREVINLDGNHGTEDSGLTDAVWTLARSGIHVRYFNGVGNRYLRGTWQLFNGGNPPEVLMQPAGGFDVAYYNFRDLGSVVTAADGSFTLPNVPAVGSLQVVVSGPGMEFVAAAKPLGTASTLGFELENGPPTLAPLIDHTMTEDDTSTLNLVLGDLHTPLNLALEMTVASDSNSLFPDPVRYPVTGSGTVRTLTLRPAPNRTGSAALRVRVTDPQGAATERTFMVHVNPAADAPAAGAQTGLKFAGPGQNVTVSHLAGMNNPGSNPGHTIEAWLNPDPLPEAVYTADFNSGRADNIALRGSALIEGGVVKVTGATIGQLGSLVVADFAGGQPVRQFVASFNLGIFGGSSTPADGFSFNLVSAAQSGTQLYGEEGSTNGLVVAFDTYDNAGGEAPAVDIVWNGVLIARTNYQASQGPGGTFASAARAVRIELTPDNKLSVTHGTNVLFSEVPVPYTPIAGALWVFAARTGGLVDNHWVDDLSITVPGAPASERYRRQWVLNLGAYGSGAHHWLLNPVAGRLDQFRLQFGIWNNIPGQVGDVVLPAGVWTHVAAVYYPGDNKYVVYTNGVGAGQATPTAAFNLTDAGSRVPLALAVPVGTDIGLAGSIDELRIWNYARELAEIGNDWRMPLTGRDLGLMGYYRFDEAVGQLAADTASNPENPSQNGGASDGWINGGAAYVPGAGSEPVTGFGRVIVGEDTPTRIFLPGYDAEFHIGGGGGSPTYEILTGPTKGVLSRSTGAWNPTNQNPIVYTPLTNRTGADQFTFRIVDANAVVSGIATVSVLITDVNDPPRISAINRLVIEEDTASPLIPFTVSDPETPADQLQVEVKYFDSTLAGNFLAELGGSGTNRTLRLTPPSGQIGVVTVRVQVLDKGSPVNLAFSDFEVRVDPRPAYAIIDLGAIAGKAASYANAINNLGWVAGYSQNLASDSQAMLYRGLETVETVATVGPAFSVASGVNDLGAVVGLNADNNRGFVWQNNQSRELPPFPTGSSTSEGRAINRDGIIAGVADKGGKVRAVIFVAATNGNSVTYTPVNLDTNASINDRSEAFAINDGGLVVGFRTAGANERAAAFTGGGVTDLGVLPGHTISRALSVNSDGLIVGYSQLTASNSARAFLLDTNLHDLGTLPGGGFALARSINDFGQIVGQAGDSNGSSRAFFYSAGRMRDLNDLVPEDASWTLTEARAINRDGWIAGTGVRSDGSVRAYLAVPARVIGRQIARPRGAVARFPEITLLNGAPGDTPQNSFFWSGVENKLYAIRPVRARINWYDTTEIVSGTGTNATVRTNRVTDVGINIWPRNPTRHVAGSPVELQPPGISLPFAWQAVEFNPTDSVQVDPNTKIYRNTVPGYTVLRYLNSGNSPVPNPSLHPPVFDVVRTYEWTDPRVRQDTNWFVGDTLTHPGHFDYYERNGFVFFERSFYDGVGEDRAHDRSSRVGPIIPVNTATSFTPDSQNRQMVVVWYQTNRLGIAWAGQPVRYSVAWPMNTTNKIIVASGLGAGFLPSGLYPDKQVYNQPDRNLPGFNPNEEHALIGAAESGTTLYALRNDLNYSGTNSPIHSEAFALLKYHDPVTGDWRIRPYRVLREESPYFFRYLGEAGKEIQPPLPLSRLPLVKESFAGAGPYWEDYAGKIYARAAGLIGDTNHVVVHWFYPLQPGFFYDLNQDLQTDVALGTAIPWLDRRPGGTAGLPVPCNYVIRWPDRDNTLQVGESLLKAKESRISGNLPEIQNQARVEIIYDSLNPTFDPFNPTSVLSVTNLARLYDPVSPRVLKTNVFIPDDFPLRQVGSVQEFTALAWSLKKRLRYDPINKWLSFAGYLDDKFDVGEPLLLPNVMTPRDRDQLIQLKPDSAGWVRTVTNLYNITRNPNAVDLEPRDNEVDLDLRLGLVTDYLLRINRQVTNAFFNTVSNLVVTNHFLFRPEDASTPVAAIQRKYGLNVVSTNTGEGVLILATNVVPESFGDQPKALTAALGNLPPATPLPGAAVSLDGLNDGIDGPTGFTLGEAGFTIEFWLRRMTNRPNMLALQHNTGVPAQQLELGFDFQNSFYVRFGTGETGLRTPANQTDTNWHHWAVTFDPVTRRRVIYLDGDVAAADVAAAPYLAGVAPLLLGRGAATGFNLGAQLDEFRLWSLPRTQFRVALDAPKRLKGSENGLTIYYRFDDSGGVVTDLTGHGYGANLGGGASFVASSAPVGIPPRYLTLALNNSADLPGLPVDLKIIRVDDGPFIGDLKVLPADNVFDQRVIFRHSSDFGGDPMPLTFEWYYQEDSANFNPSALPDPNASASQLDATGWVRYTGGAGLNEHIIGQGGESGLLTISDTWWICRYRGFAVNLRPTNLWAGWVGDPAASPEQPRARLSEGWIKRVIRGLNPFDARVADFHAAPVNTLVSMLSQAGQRYEGDIAFNPAADAINSVGLIEAYETVFRRGKTLSIEGVPPVNFDPANNALMLAASKISDLYLLLGNEAYGDAQDPTIGFGSSSAAYGSLSSSIFAFQNQLDSLTEEELVLLRGRDDRNAGVSGRGVYNRLFWNFTLGEGEVAYQQVYNIGDVTGGRDNAGRDTPDGFIDERDARAMYPQGHGDAWGHYLSAIKGYYQLLRHPFFTWVPRTENVTVQGAAVKVDFLDERKFARAAAARARTGKEVVDLTYRQQYTEEPAGQWQGYRDTDPDRSWGVTEWARRAGQGAYFDWLTANTILPAIDRNTNHVGIDRIDRTTVDELDEITAQMNEVQARLDQADAGLNPLGLAKGATIFDIDPTFNAVGSTAQIGRQAVQGLGHFEQIKERAVKTLNNAARVWDEANSASQQLRQSQDSLEQFNRDYQDREIDFKSRLIEIFGYPYAGEMGPGKLYPSGYDGPDLYHWMYVPVTEITGDNSPPSGTFTAFFTAPSTEANLNTNNFFLGFSPATLEVSILQVPFKASAGLYGFAATSDMGARRAQGELQYALAEMVQANAQLKINLQNYDGQIQDIQAAIGLLALDYNVNSNKIEVLNEQRDTIEDINISIGVMKGVEKTVRRLAQLERDVADAIAAGLPRVVGLAADVTSAGRGALTALGAALNFAGEITGDLSEVSQTALELSKDAVNLQAGIDVLVEDQRYEVQQRVKEIEHQVRNEAALRIAVFQQSEVLRQAAQRVLTKLAEGQRLVEELVTYRRNTSSQITERRYQDMTFRIFRNDALQKYRAQFDLAARYCYLAATVYDYETCFLGNDSRAGRRFLNDIVKQRALGQMRDGGPIVGPPGLANSIARLESTFEVLRGQFGINNPQLETGVFSLRGEFLRLQRHDEPDLGPDGLATTPEEIEAVAAAQAANAVSDPVWRTELNKFRVANLWNVPEFRRHCRPFAPELAGPQPALVIPFSTTVTFGLNFFGWPLGGGDSAYDPTLFATKINAVGIQFTGYDAAGLSQTPRVYLIPVGNDVLRSPTGDTLATRAFRIFDQALPTPFPIGDSDIGQLGWIPGNDSLSGQYGELRKFSSLRAFADSGDYLNSEIITSTRLIGRSVWNTQWMLIIPGGTLLANPNQGLDQFVNSVTDIKWLLMTYSYSGN